MVNRQWSMVNKKDTAMAKFIVYCTQIYNGTIEVEAENEDEAVRIVQQEKLDEVDFDFGEATADFADEITD